MNDTPKWSVMCLARRYTTHSLSRTRWALITLVMATDASKMICCCSRYAICVDCLYGFTSDINIVQSKLDNKFLYAALRMHWSMCLMLTLRLWVAADKWWRCFVVEAHVARCSGNDRPSRWHDTTCTSWNTSQRCLGSDGTLHFSAFLVWTRVLEQQRSPPQCCKVVTHTHIRTYYIRTELLGTISQPCLHCILL